MTRGKFWIGLDLGEDAASMCVVNEAGDTIEEVDCPIASLPKALTPYRKSRIGLIAVEAGVGTHVVRKLVGRGYPVGIFEARKANKFLTIRRNKTDSGDAKGLADLARLGRTTVSRVYLKSIDLDQLRGQLLLRRRLVKLRVAIENGIRARIKENGGNWKIPYGPGSLRRHLKVEIPRLERVEKVALKAELEPLVDVAESLRKYVKSLDATLRETAENNPVCARLMEVPGVGPLCALGFYTAVEDPKRFSQACDIGAYFGLVPRRYQSGETARTVGITKTGNKVARQLLVTAAMTLTRCASRSALKDWGHQLRERIGSSRARVAVARKLAVILLIMWRDGKHFEAYPSSRLATLSS